MPRPRRYNDVAEDEAKLSQFVEEAKAIADAKKAHSDAYSALPRRYLGATSALPRRCLGGASALPRRYLGATSATSLQVVSDADLESLLGVVMDQVVQGEGTC